MIERLGNHWVIICLQVQVNDIKVVLSLGKFEFNELYKLQMLIVGSSSRPIRFKTIGPSIRETSIASPYGKQKKRAKKKLDVWRYWELHTD
jgi:hypothetical protein